MARFVIKYEAHYRDRFGRFIAEADAAEIEAVNETLTEFEEVAKSFAPERTGALRDSITAARHGKSGTIFTENDHAAPQEYGAGPHLIPDAFGYETVHHPGNPATHFLARAAEYMQAKFVRNVERLFPKG